MTYLETNLYGLEAPPPDEPSSDDRQRNGAQAQEAPTTWEAIDLGPYLRGEVDRPQPSMGIARSDGTRVIYPGLEHVVLGETESGKTWFADACVAAELRQGRYVLYVHYEESDPTSTVERLLLLGADPVVIAARLRFVAPSRPLHKGWLEPLLDPAPSLAVHDGVNEAMALHGADIMAAEGASLFRRRLIMPCLRAGAATLACDHLPKSARESGRRDAAYGSVHKGNAINGARILLENVEPFGRGLRGRSHVFITKDRPGSLRALGRPTKTPGTTFVGSLVVDDSQTFGPDFVMRFYAPRDDESQPVEDDPGGELANAVHDVICALPDHEVGSMRLLLAELRKAGHGFRHAAVREAVDDLIVAGLVTEIQGPRNGKRYRAAPTVSATVSPSVSLLGRETRETVAHGPLPTVSETVGNTRKQSEGKQ
ncbi:MULTISPECIES: hypothetical protein [unclassified Mycobacterium]|uniref:hypothetical protein n=1 Tax=unclassified Mycobacterium TaxID=2642494 RepID=UPI000800A12E|nr:MULTISPECIES: hypothetical protein [unclassified Mycobacterium]OBG76249.1 hypothetical protein A5700_22465 [Mycobacterium sp. E1214]OBH23790.1 hypothetical protein A5693_09605 [Mycobacterium sp. E1319]